MEIFSIYSHSLSHPVCSAIIVDMDWISLIHNTLLGAEFPLSVCCNLGFPMEVNKAFPSSKVFHTSLCAFVSIPAILIGCIESPGHLESYREAEEVEIHLYFFAQLPISFQLMAKVL